MAETIASILKPFVNAEVNIFPKKKSARTKKLTKLRKSTARKARMGFENIRDLDLDF